MGRKMRSANSIKENNSLQGSNGTISLDSTRDTDIIECSMEIENHHKLLSNGKCILKSLDDIQTPKIPLQSNEMQNINNTCRQKNSKDFRGSSKIGSRLIEEVSNEKEALSLQTPCSRKSIKDSNSVIKKMISTLKKTPDAPLLSISKLRNIEKWLRENEVENVRTPPFANLSVTPMKSSRKKFSECSYKNKKPEDSSIDSEVEGVLKAVYGDDWQQKNIQSMSKTESKKKSKKFFTPISQTKKSDVKRFHSVRRNILNVKNLNLSNISDEENNFDDSALSGIRILNLDDSGCCDEKIKSNLLKSFKKKRKLGTSESSCESLYPTTKKKESNIASVDNIEKKRQNRKTPACKNIPTSAALKTPKKTFLASLSVSTPTSKCHPDAQYYKINFKSKKDELVKKLYKLYNSEVFEGRLMEDMNFSWNVKLRGTAGYCYNKRVTKSTGEVIRLSRIEFSTKIVDRADRLRDTMIHELCHAASWVIDGVLDGHGDVWNKWVSRAMERFSELPQIRRCHNYEIVSKYVYRCTGCGYSIKRHSKSINTERKRCGHCYGTLELLINKKKRGKNEVPEFDTTRTLPTPNKFAMFVKENYHSVKSTKNNAKHSEIMKILSEKYAFLKSEQKSAKKAEIEG